MSSADPFDFLENTGVYLDNKKEVIRKLELIIRLRWFVSPFVFGILCIAEIFGIAFQRTFSLIPVLINTAIILVLNIIYKLSLKKISDLRPLFYLQLLIDTIHFSLTVYQTGGITSPFTFLYLGVILASAILLSRLAITIAVFVTGFFYSLLIVLELTRVLKHNNIFIPLSGMENIPSYVVLSWLFNLASFIAVAFFASYLFTEIRKHYVALQDSNLLLNRKVKTFLLLFKTSEAINSYAKIDDLIDYILDELLDFLNLDRALLYLVKNKKKLKLYRMVNRYEIRNESNAMENLEIPLDMKAGLTARVALTNQAMNVVDPEKASYINRKLATKIGMNPFAIAPLSINKRVLGVLGIDRNIKNGAISEEEFKILKIFANHAAIAIHSHERVAEKPGKYITVDIAKKQR